MSKDDEINELLAEIDLEDERDEDNLSPLNTVHLDAPPHEEQEQPSTAVEDGGAEAENEKDSSAVEEEIEHNRDPGSQAPRPSVPAKVVAPSHRSPAIPEEVKEAASMAAAVTREAAADVAKEFTKMSTQAQSFFSNMWQQFDPLAATQSVQEGDRDTIDVKTRFGIDNTSEKVLESFRCTLIQTYAPSDNAFTPMKAIGFTGACHILESHIAFEFDNPSNGKAIVIPLSEVNKVERDPANGGSLVCRLIGGRTFCVGRFLHGALELDSAMNLLELRLSQV